MAYDPSYDTDDSAVPHAVRIFFKKRVYELVVRRFADDDLVHAGVEHAALEQFDVRVTDAHRPACEQHLVVGQRGRGRVVTQRHPQAGHQHGPRVGDAVDVPARRGRLVAEAVARQRRRDDGQPVRTLVQL